MHLCRPVRVVRDAPGGPGPLVDPGEFRESPGSGLAQAGASVADSDPWQGVALCARKMTARRWRSWHCDVDIAQEPPEALFVLVWGLKQRGASAAALPCAGPRKLARRTSGSTTNSGMAPGDCQPPKYEEATRFFDRGGGAAARQPWECDATSALPRSTPDGGRGGRRLPPCHPIEGRLQHCSLRSRVCPRRAGAARRGNRRLPVRIELKPDYARAHYGLGTCLFRRGRLDEAVAALRKAIALEPDHAESHCNLGLALWKQGELAPAVISLERGHELGSRRRTGAIRRPSGCENAAGSSSSVAGCETVR